MPTLEQGSMRKIGVRAISTIRDCVAVRSLVETHNAQSGRAADATHWRPNVGRRIDWGNTLSFNYQMWAKRASDHHPLIGKYIANVTADGATQD